MKDRGSYTNYKEISNQAHEEAEPVADLAANEEVTSITEEAEPIIEDIKEEETVVTTKGKVVNCVSLNLRLYPDKSANVLEVIPEDTIVEIVEKESTDDFYKAIIENGTEGYAMKNYISIIK